MKILKVMFVLTSTKLNLSESFGDCISKSVSVTRKNGEIETQHYSSGGYKNNQQECWIITGDNQSQIELKYLDGNMEFSVNCSKDYGAVYDYYNDERKHLMWKFCGKVKKNLGLKSKSNKIFIKFISDGWISGLKGFRLTYAQYLPNQIEEKENVLRHVFIVIGAVAIFSTIGALFCIFRHYYHRRKRNHGTTPAQKTNS